MRHQHLFPEAAAPLPRSGISDHLRRDTRQVAPLFTVFGAKYQRHQTWSALDYAKAELLRQAVAESCGSHLRDRKAARGDDDGLCFKEGRCGFYSKMSVAHD